MTQIRIAGLIQESIVDGPGIRYVVFAQGCRHNCAGCHNPHTHSFEGGTMVDLEVILHQIKGNPLLDGITLSGGEPLEQAGVFVELVRAVRKMDLNVMIYSGYTYEEIMSNSPLFPDGKRLLQYGHILVDGRFMKDKQDYRLAFKGSRNQRIIDLVKTRQMGEIILWTGGA